jgi:hypothetical protein
MPPGVVSFKLTYKYPRFTGKESSSEAGKFTPKVQSSIIDLGLIAPNGSQVGASGSDKLSFEISETFATPGYNKTRLIPGEWNIILGAYKVASQGIMVAYELTFEYGEVRLLKGDLHTHTVASDGVLTLEELGKHARAHGLDFLAITDHNQVISSDALPDIPGLTMIPGVEWTHYKGHANFTGVDKPFGGSFIANTPQEVTAKFQEAHQNGALITINHPFDENVPFTFDLETLPFDCYEVWNGPMRMSNIQAIGTWSGMLASGKKTPIVCGSDYHRSQLFLYPGGPTTCVYAPSAGRSDILSALKLGHSYLVYAPDGPTLEFKAGDAIMGDSVSFAETKEMQVSVKGLQTGDVLQVVTGQDSTQLAQAESNGDFEGNFVMPASGFARVEVHREFIPGVPRLPALISNPIYFDGD